MSENPFLVLGLTRDATQAEVEEAYIRLRDKYRLDMHQEGDMGRYAAERLSEVEKAYSEIKTLFEAKINYDGNIYSTIEQFIKNNKYDEAQNALDKISERGAEWHYYQSAIYYKKGWLTEARSQLKLAVSMDPDNEKYANAYRKLDDKLNNRTRAEYQQNMNNGYQRSYQQNAGYRDETADSCCACCQGLLCANCLCDCLRCM